MNKWLPAQETVNNSQLLAFKNNIEKSYKVELNNYDELHKWSITNIENFWQEVWDFCGVIASSKGGEVIEPAEKMWKTKFFPKAKLNFAENLLKRRDGAVAITFKAEDVLEQQLTFNELYGEVSKLAQAMRDAGIVEGDRVAGYLPNAPIAVVAMLATASLGAIWVSASPDFGVSAVLDRFGQVEPKILFAVDGYQYGGKYIDCRSKLADIVKNIPSLKKIIISDYLPTISNSSLIIDKELRYKDFVSTYDILDINFVQMDFNAPLYIMFSSGTTGVPKCIVHSIGGVLLQHLKEHQLHCDIKRGENIFYFTTCGWMMWQWLVSALASSATIMLYDGSPFYPSPYVLFDYADKYNCNFFGTSAKFIDALKKNEACPKEHNKLTNIRMLASTGSPLVHEAFDYIYSDIKEDIHIASISGGTDIISCFVLGNPISPVYRGEIQGAGLGMNVDVFDENGNSLQDIAGDLVCKTPFPSMPIYFFNDIDEQKYETAYFDKFENIWSHGDWCQKTKHKGFVIYGRSDATLNPGGVRIGTAEIYRQVEKIDEVKESIAVGQDMSDGDMRVILFVVLADNVKLDDKLKTKIKTTIREGATPRHVPAKIIVVTDIPRTKSGKITELAVKHVIHKREVKNKGALANPEALELFKNLEELKG